MQEALQNMKKKIDTGLVSAPSGWNAADRFSIIFRECNEPEMPKRKQRVCTAD